MSSSRWVKSVLTAILVVAACATNAEVGDGETHWLRVCSSDGDCRGSGSCICGLCTMACDDGTECVDGPPGSVCVPSGSVPECSERLGAATHVCALRCDEAGICPDELSCHDGVCGPPSMEVGDGGADAFASEASVDSGHNLADVLQSSFPGACLVDGKVWANGAIFWRACDQFCKCEDGSAACDASICSPCSLDGDAGSEWNFCDVGPDCTARTGFWTHWEVTMYPEQPVCGCDGTTYESGNVATAAHVSIAKPGACDAAISCWVGQILDVEDRGQCLCTGSELTSCTGETPDP
jgi:hypothetical protein